jgi:hypothetical protein
VNKNTPLIANSVATIHAATIHATTIHVATIHVATIHAATIHIATSQVASGWRVTIGLVFVQKSVQWS